MKKGLTIIVLGSVVLLALVYLFIPGSIRINSGVVINASGPAIQRALLDNENVTRWWPGKKTATGWELNGFKYTFNKGNITVLPVAVTGTDSTLSTLLYLVSITEDSTRLEWVGVVNSASNPAQRVDAYFKTKQLQKDFSLLLNKMKTFYNSTEHIYGFDIQQTLVMDSNLVATAGRSKGYPTTRFIYAMVDQLTAYATSMGATASGYPMVNIIQANDSLYDVRVALPTDSILKSKGNIEEKRMPGRTIILKTQVTGGPYQTEKAMAAIANYAADYRHKAPAIPFYSLVTDRRKETDTSKWKTAVYFPVMIYPK